MQKTLILAVVALLLAGGVFVVTRPDTTPHTASGRAEAPPPADGEPIVDITLPATLSDEARMGETAFNAVCADCHGENARGKMGFGPPLVHKIYEPSHHADMAFQLAVQRGVSAHHWGFGDMPPQPGLTTGDVKPITRYVRELQLANGIE